MFFSGNFIAALLAIAAVGVTASPVELERRSLGNIQYCDANGGCATQAINAGDGCRGFDRTVDHIIIDNGVACTLYEDGGCAPPQYASQVGLGPGEYYQISSAGWNAYICYAAPTLLHG